MELVDSTINNKYYSNVTITRSGLPSGYPVDNSYSNPNQYLSKVTGSGNKIGSAIILRVMAGDKFNLRVSSWYKKNGATPQTPNNPLYDLINALTNNIGNIPTSHGTVNELVSNNSLNPGALSFYALHNSADSTTKPKAFINWVLFDEQFNYVSANSGFEQVGGDNTLTVHTRNNQAINKNGYLYIYVSNETPNIDVYFDNLQVTQVRGPLLEETHYYPFGLAMNGISSIASKNQYPENKYKFNSGTQLADKEFSDGIGLNIYETPFRGYDPQIGRFQQADPLAEISNEWSPYSFCLDNPVLLIDPLGLSSGPGPETSTKSKPKLLGGVTVTGYRKKSLIVLLQDNTLPINNQPKGTPHVPLPPPTTNAKTSGTDIAGAGAIALTAEESAGVSIGVTVGSAATGGLVLFVWYLTTIAGPHEGHPMLPRPGFAIRDQTYIPSTVVLPMSYAIPNTGTPPRAIPKPILMPFSEQYALRARTNGWYPNYVWGKGQVAPVYLHRGDIWKIGTSMAGSKRYLESFYDNIGAGLDYDREFGPAPLDQVLFMEILKLSQYKTTHNGEFPPGNTKWQ
jgi:RHS repeat-associated protein